VNSIRRLIGWIIEWAMLILFSIVLIVIWPFIYEAEDKKDE
jgi:cbb3-type cytochrome oxidase subunit 3